MFKKDGRFWFLFVFILLFLEYEFQEILRFPPHSIHSWRQSDCLSLAQNFMDENNPMNPSIHNYISDGGKSGKSAGEFTGLYYVIGKIWTITGKSQGIYRLFNLGFLFLGCFYLFKGLNLHWRNTFWSVFVSLFVFTSPLIVYYSPNYLTDITALSFTIWGWGIFLVYLKNNQFKSLIFSISLFALAALFKVTAGISFLALLGVFGLEIVQILGRNRVLFPKKLKTVFLFVLTGIVVVSWYIYAESYNAIHFGKYTFNSLWPLWSLSDQNYQNAIKFFTEITFDQFFFSWVTWFFIPLTLLALVLAFLKNKTLFIFLIFTLLGSGCYIIFWFGALENHDYYFINLFSLPILILAVNINYLLKTEFYFRFKTGLIVFACCFFGVGVVYSSINIRLRYSERLKFNLTLAQGFYKQKQIDYWEYTASTYRNRGLFTMEQYNRKKGIKPSDLIICYPDPSFNTSLFLLNQKGWTSFNNPNHESILVKDQIKSGAKYLIVNRIELPLLPQLTDYMKDSIGYYEGFTLYKLTK